MTPIILNQLQLYLITLCLSVGVTGAIVTGVWSLSLAVMVLLSGFWPTGLVSGIGDGVRLPSCWFGDHSASSLPSVELGCPVSKPCSQVERVPYPLLSTVTIPSSELSWGWTVSWGCDRGLAADDMKVFSAAGSSRGLWILPGSRECIWVLIWRFCNCTNALISSCMSWKKIHKNVKTEQTFIIWVKTNLLSD